MRGNENSNTFFFNQLHRISMHFRWLRKLVSQGCEMCGVQASAWIFDCVGRVWKPDPLKYVFVMYRLWIELGILHPDVNREVLTSWDFLRSCFSWESWQRSRNVNEYMDTDLVIQHYYFSQLRYSSGIAYCEVYYDTAFLIFLILSKVFFLPVLLIWCQSITQLLTNMHTYNPLDKWPEKLLDPKIRTDISFKKIIPNFI